MIISSIVEAIGNTPLFRVPESVHSISWLTIYAKCEFLNPFWSIKDRTALGILRSVPADSSQIIESSSGNTAKALGILALLQEKNLLTVTNRIRSREMEDMLRVIGVEINHLPPGSECPDPNDPSSPFMVIRRHMEQYPDRYYWTDQYTNRFNTDIHRETTAREINADIGVPDYFFSGLGTTGSSGGIVEYFSGRVEQMHSVGIVTASGSYIPWIRNAHEMSDVGLFRKDMYDDFVSVADQDAIDALLILVRRCGLLVWPTTGAVFHGMLSYLRKQNPELLRGKTAVFIACDRLEPYMGYLREKRSEIFQTSEKGSDMKKSQAIWPLKTIVKDELSNHLVVDMRSYPSYSLDHIPGSISFPFHALQKHLSDWYLPFPRETPIVFVCPFGEESELLCQMANGLGYDSYSLEGGFVAGYKKG